jgi:hypothetical protein
MRVSRLAAFLFVVASTGFAQRTERILWREPGAVGKADLGGTVVSGIPSPKAPFTFVHEDMAGTQPKLLVKDSAGTTWNIKFGNEVRPECFTWRLPRAIGYFVEPSFYIASGKIEGMQKMQRQTPSLKADGRFTDARFQYRDPAIRFIKQTWTWTDNPFRGTPQLHGLEILVMLASNWDNKDGRAGLEQTNTGMFEHRAANGARELIYSFIDWGSGMGAWGDTGGQTDWNCSDYTRESASFIKGVQGGQVVFAFEGHIHEGFQTGITPADVAWLMKYLGQISDAQLRAALHATGATARDESCFTAAIRSRIEALRRVSIHTESTH